MPAPVRLSAAKARLALDEHGSVAGASRALGVSTTAFIARMGPRPKARGTCWQVSRLLGAFHRHGITIADMQAWFGFTVPFIVSAIRRYEAEV